MKQFSGRFMACCDILLVGQ